MPMSNRSTRIRRPYVREVEEGDSATYLGSLSIGSLRQP